jgi:hypothetical protein
LGVAAARETSCGCACWTRLGGGAICSGARAATEKMRKQGWVAAAAGQNPSGRRRNREGGWATGAGRLGCGGGWAESQRPAQEQGGRVGYRRRNLWL